MEAGLRIALVSLSLISLATSVSALVTATSAKRKATAVLNSLLEDPKGSHASHIS